MQTSGVQCGIAAVDTGKGGDIGDCRVIRQQTADRLLFLTHGLKRHRLRRFQRALNQSVILDREKAFRNKQIEHDGDRHGTERNPECQPLMAQHPCQPAAVTGNHPLKKAFSGTVKAVMAVSGFRFQEPGAHHRCQCQ